MEGIGLYPSTDHMASASLEVAFSCNFKKQGTMSAVWVPEFR